MGAQQCRSRHQGYPAAVDLAEAWRVLGLGVTTDAGAVRGRYLQRLVEVHPDRSSSPDANDETVELNAAYRVVIDWISASTRFPGDVAGFGGRHARPRGAPTDGTGDGAASGEPPGWRRRDDGRSPASSAFFVPISMIDGDTIAVGAPAAETYYLLTEASHDLGEIAHYDPSSSMLSIIVEFVDEPVCQILCVLQGRATGVTEIFVSLESLDSTPAPPIDAVTRLFMEAMISVSHRA